MSTESDQLVRLYPTPSRAVTLQRLFLAHELHLSAEKQRPCVYTNFVTSLDGRIAITPPGEGKTTVPKSLTNPRDWRLFQELAAQADVLLTTGRYLRELSAGHAQDALPVSDDDAFADLHEWRQQQGLPPQPAVAIVSRSLDLPFDLIKQQLQRPVYILTTENANPRRKQQAQQAGATVLTAGEEDDVEGELMVSALMQQGFRSLYAIAGPHLLNTLIRDRMLDRLYLTQVSRLLGGSDYHTLLESSLLQPPADLTLQALYLDQGHEDGIEQTFAIYHRR